MAQDGTQDGGRGSGETLPRFAPWLRWGGLLGVPALAYVPALLNPLLAIDDPRYVTRNPLVLGDWSALFRFYEGEYLPVGLLSYALDHWIWGEAAFGYHLTSLLLHLACVAVLYRLLRDRFFPDRPGIAFTAALLFALHPLNVEAVAWVAGRRTILSTLFCLLAFRAYTREGGRGGRGLGWFLLAGLSKASVVAMPLAFAWYDRAVQRRSWRAALTRAIGPAAVGGSAAALQVYGGWEAGYLGPQVPSLWAHWGLAVRALWDTCRRLVVPLWPAYRYDFPAPTAPYGPELGALAGLGLLGAAVGWFCRRRPERSLWAGWFLAGLLPVAQLIPSPVLLADRYLYLPGIGGLVLGCLAAAVLVRRLARSPARAGRVGMAVLALVVVGFAGLVGWRGRVWRDERTLLTDTLARHPDSPWARFSLGVLEEQAGDFPAAAGAYRRALTLNPHFPRAQLNLGSVLLELRELEEAETVLAGLDAAVPDHPLVLTNLGLLRQMQGRPTDARALWERALALNPRTWEVAYLLAEQAARRGDWPAAEGFYRRAVDAGTPRADAYAKLAGIMVDRGDVAEARRLALEAQRRGALLPPGFWERLDGSLGAEGP